MSSPLEGTASAADAIARVHYSHDAMIDLMIANPAVTQNALAKHFGYSVPWVSRIVNSDAFNARLAERKTEMVDPSILMSIEEKFKALADQSMAIVAEKLAVTKDPKMAMEALELSSKALGYGARSANVQMQANFVVAMPQKAASTQAWVEKYSGGVLEAGQTAPGAPQVLENSPDLRELVQASQ